MHAKIRRYNEQAAHTSLEPDTPEIIQEVIGAIHGYIEFGAMLYIFQTEIRAMEIIVEETCGNATPEALSTGSNFNSRRILEFRRGASLGLFAAGPLARVRA